MAELANGVVPHEGEEISDAQEEGGEGEHEATLIKKSVKMESEIGEWLGEKRMDHFHSFLLQMGPKRRRRMRPTKRMSTTKPRIRSADHRPNHIHPPFSLIHFYKYTFKIG
jgi:hypothetical protein